MSYNINKIFSNLEEELIQKYKRSMEKGIENEDGWQMKKLQDLRKYKEEARKTINKQTRMAMDEATGVISDSYGKGIIHAEGLVTKTSRVLDDEAFGRLNRRKMDALLDSVKNDFNKTSMATLRMVDDEYRQIVYQSQVAFNSGATTLRQSVDMASKDFLHKGINAIRYKNGNNVNIASYAEMVIRNSAKKAYLTGEGSKMAEWGEHLVQVTSYGGCSDTCLPWQGRVYFDDVFSGGVPSEDNKYPLLSMAMAEGLYHPNCRHTHNPYFEGVSEEPARKTGEEIEEIRENYRAEQQQRYNERKIREWKRVEEGSLDPDNQVRARDKVKAWQGVMRKHIEEHPNLRRKYSREQIIKAGDIGIKDVDFEDIARKYPSYTDMWFNLSPEQQVEFKELLVQKDMKMKEFWDLATEEGKNVTIPEWKEYQGSVSEYKLNRGLDISSEKFDIILSNDMGTTTGNANKGVISLNKEHVKDMGIESIKRVVDHEIGHRLTEISGELQELVLDNPEGALGRYNLKRGFFEGLFGESSPEESWAEAFSVYLNDPRQLERRYPKAFEAIDNVIKSDKTVQIVVDNYHKKLKKLYG